LNEIKNQFGEVIKTLRSNNAKEYFSSVSSVVLSSHGILHEFTYRRTLQQNGIAKRKNRHLGAELGKDVGCFQQSTPYT